MKRIEVAMLCGLAVLRLAAGEGFYGAWATAESPQVPCLVFTNSIAWTLRTDLWRPSVRSIDEAGTRIVYDCIGASAAERQVVQVVAERDCSGFNAQGISVRPGDRVWYTVSAEDSTAVKNCRKIVPTVMPKWEKTRALKPYVGCWEPVAAQHRQERLPIKIRSDLTLVEKVATGDSDRRRRKPYRIFKLRACEGGLRLETKPSHGGRRDPLNEYVEGLWLNPAGELIRYGDCEQTTYVRSQKPFDDPAERRTQTSETGKLSGTWGVSVEFTIFVLTFCEDGRGIMSGFMAQVPFRWKTEKQRIHCVLDKDFAVLIGGSLTEFDCEYDAARDRMTLKLPEGVQVAGSREMPTELPRMPGEVTKEQMDAIFKRVEEIKQDPQFKMQLEGLKRR